MKKYPKPELLAIFKRGNTIEALHHGWICVLNKEKKIIYKRGDIFDSIFLRSALKPIQAIPIIENDLNVSDKELSIACGSHSGSKKHLEILNNFMKKQGLKISNLQCGTHLPFDEREKTKLISKNISPNPLHNNCSGKHLGMLAVCKKKNWDLKTYLNPDHPLQKTILNKIKELSGSNKISIATDGCGLPTFALSVINIAKMFSNFTYGSNQKFAKIISAMTKYPYFVGGTGQIDTEIMKRTKGRLIVKVGALGIIIVAHKGNSLVLKITDGSPIARSFVVLKLLAKLGWLKKTEIKNSILEEILKGEVKNHVGKKVGEIITLL